MERSFVERYADLHTCALAEVQAFVIPRLTYGDVEGCDHVSGSWTEGT